LADHAGIIAADATTGMRLGHRAAGRDHDEVLAPLREAGPNVVALEEDLVQLLAMKTKTDHDPR